MQRSGKTENFRKKYLVPGKAGKGYWLYGMIADARGADIKSLAADIRRMPYDQFMSTRYWRLVSIQVKQEAHWCCQQCGRHSHDLEVHHEGYNHHGYEMFRYKELRCLCPECHERKHLPRKKTA